MPRIKYAGPEQLSPPLANGPASTLILPRGLEVEISEEIAAQIRKNWPPGEISITAGEEQAAPDPAKSLKK
jgi:hypothetical protein